MQLPKEAAIELANAKKEKTGEKFYVIWEPEKYNSIFNNNGYKVVNEEYMIDLEEQGFSRKALINYETN